MVHPPDNGDWSETPAVATDEQVLVRSHFTVPAGTVVQSAAVFTSNRASLLELWFNGIKLYTGPSGEGELDCIIDPATIVVGGGDNVLALWLAAHGEGAPYTAFAVEYVS